MGFVAALLVLNLTTNVSLRLVLPSAAVGLIVAAGLVLGENGERRRLRVLDIFLAAAFVAGTLLPVFRVAFGPTQVGFRDYTSDEFAARALIGLVVFVAGALIGWFASPRPSAGQADGDNQWPRFGFCLLLLLLGLVGLGIRVASGKISGTVIQEASTVGPGIGLLGTLLTPLVAPAVFFIAARRAATTTSVLIGVALAPVAIYALATYSLNRAVFIVPIASAFWVLVKTRRLRNVGRWAVAGGTLIVWAFVIVGQIRQEQVQTIGGGRFERLGFFEFLERSLVVYFQSPHLVGVAYSQQDLYETTSLIASALAPVPGFGEGYRGSTGADLYNQTIYGTVSQDQILPIWTELDLSLGLVGLLAISVIFGLILKGVDLFIAQERSVFRLYAGIFAAVWLAQAPIVSLSIFAQIFVYFMVPLLLLAFMEQRNRQIGDPRGVGS